MAGRVVVITGSPGTGKTTVCASMARAGANGVHIRERRLLLVRCAGSRVKAPAGAELVRQMHAAFSRLEPYEAHAFDIGTRDLLAVLSELSRRRQNGGFQLAAAP